MSLNACGKHGFRGHGVCEGCVRDDERKKYDAEAQGRVVSAVERIANAFERAAIAVERVSAAKESK